MPMFTRSSPIYVQICQQFESKIFDGTLPAGTRLPSTTELAEEFQVNPETIQTALTQLTRRGLVERRRGAGTFVRPGVKGRTAAIVFGDNNFARIDRAFFNVLSDRITKRLVKAGWAHQHFITTEESVADRAFHSLQTSAAEGKVQAIIEFCSNDLVRDWLERQCPVPHTCCEFSFDNRHLLEQALTYLFRLGRRDVAVIHNHSELNAEMGQALATSLGTGMSLGPVRLRMFQCEAKEVDGHAVALALIDDPAGCPDAIASLCDSQTRGVIHALLQRGKRIGEDVALITHANKGIDIFCHLPLTRLEIDPDEVADSVIQEIQARVDGIAPTLTTIRTRVIPGRSCGESA